MIGELRDYEGLVHATARMFACMVGKEEEDLRQELRVIVWRALEKFDPGKCKTDVRRYVYGCIANKVKDYKRDASRRAKHGVTFMYIEDMRPGACPDGGSNRPAQEAFDGRYHFAARDEVYGAVDEGTFSVPATVTESEMNVLLLLMMGLAEVRIALRLTMSRADVRRHTAALKDKFADWKPDNDPSSSDGTARAVPPDHSGQRELVRSAA